MNTDLLASAADSYGIPLPDYLTQAQALLDAATLYRQQVEALEPPDLRDVTPRTIAKTVDAVLAYSQRGERLHLARQVEAHATTALGAAFDRFAGVLVDALAPAFDELAATFTSAFDRGEQQDPATAAALGELVKVRDALAAAVVGSGLPAPYDRATRIATFADREDLANRSRNRTAGLQRGSAQWLEALLSLPGTRLRWMTPAAQLSHVASLPAGRDGIRITTGGNAA